MRVLSMDGEGGTPAQGFGAFFETEWPTIRRVVLRLSGGTGIADELAQEAMLRAWRDWDRIRHYDLPSIWVRRVAINLTRSRLRRKVPNPVPVVSYDDPEVVDPDAPVFVAVRALPERQRIAVLLRYLEDMAITDITAVMGSSEVAGKRLRSQLPTEVLERG